MSKFELISTVMATLAFFASIFSLYLHFQDRPVLKVLSDYYPSPYDGTAYIALSLINSGKRPLIVRMWGGTDEKGKSVGYFIGEEKKGLRLGEKERHDIALRKDNMLGDTPDGTIVISELWVEDSLGKRYIVPNSKYNVSKLINS